MTLAISASQSHTAEFALLSLQLPPLTVPPGVPVPRSGSIPCLVGEDSAQLPRLDPSVAGKVISSLKMRLGEAKGPEFALPTLAQLHGPVTDWGSHRIFLSEHLDISMKFCSKVKNSFSHYAP